MPKTNQKGLRMIIKKKPIESVRIREDRALKLKEKAWEISIKIKDQVTEAELVNFLLDNLVDKIDVTKDGKLFITEE